MTDAIVSTRSKEAMLGFAAAYAALARQKPDRATLKALIEGHLPAANVAPTLALLAQLTDGDVAEIFAAVSKETRALYKPIVEVLDLMVVACTEDVPFNTREQMKAVVDGLKFKFLAKSSNVDDSLYQLCPYTPAALPFPGFHDAVKSDIPTLVKYGCQRQSDIDRRGASGDRWLWPVHSVWFSRGRSCGTGLLAMRKGYRSGLRRRPGRVFGDKLHRDAETDVHPALRLTSQPFR